MEDAGPQVEHAPEFGARGELTAEARPHRSLEQSTRRSVSVVHGAHEEPRRGGRMAEQRSSGRADAPVRERQYRLARPFVRGIEAVELDRPLRIRLGKRQLARRPPDELIIEQLDECVRPAAECKNARRQSSRLDTDGERRRRRGLGHQHERVASRHPADRAELVAAEEHGVWTDAEAGELAEQPVRGLRLVGQADLDVLHVAGDARIAQAGTACRCLGEGCDLSEPRQTCRREPALDRLQELADPCLRRICALRLRDQIDLPPVQSVQRRSTPACRARPAARPSTAPQP